MYGLGQVPEVCSDIWNESGTLEGISRNGKPYRPTNDNGNENNNMNILSNLPRVIRGGGGNVNTNTNDTSTMTTTTTRYWMDQILYQRQQEEISMYAQGIWQ